LKSSSTIVSVKLLLSISKMQAQPNSSEDGSSGEVFDFIIVGGGIGGTAVASRLYERDPSLSILLIEADPDSSKTPLAEAVASPVKAPLLKRSELDWSYETVPQKHLDGLKVYVGAGKAMRGGSVINYGTHNIPRDYGEALMGTQDSGPEEIQKTTTLGLK
jgi:choline dehydrogenase-like flavoprotein